MDRDHRRGKNRYNRINRQFPQHAPAMIPVSRSLPAESRCDGVRERHNSTETSRSQSPRKPGTDGRSVWDSVDQAGHREATVFHWSYRPPECQGVAGGAWLWFASLLASMATISAAADRPRVRTSHGSTIGKYIGQQRAWPRTVVAADTLSRERRAFGGAESAVHRRTTECPSPLTILCSPPRRPLIRQEPSRHVTTRATR